MKIAKMNVVVVVTVLAVLMVTGAKCQPTSCASAVTESCTDTPTTTSAKECCAAVGDLYQNDPTCLCTIFQLGNLTREDVNKVFDGCGIETGGEQVCSGDSPPAVSSSDDSGSKSPPIQVPSTPKPTTSSGPSVVPLSSKTPPQGDMKKSGAPKNTMTRMSWMMMNIALLCWRMVA